MIIKIYGIKEIFVPYYSCKTIWQAVKEEDCKIKFYHIDKNFMPIQKFNKNSYILYINYFGVCENNCQKLSSIYPNLICDNTQGFYSKKFGLACFNSLRKFFPVQNGAELFLKNNLRKNILSNLEQDELKLKITNFYQDYDCFKENELKFDKESIKVMSNEVQAQMKKFDFEKDKNLRRKLFVKYSKYFDKYNLIQLQNTDEGIPYCYPFCTNNVEILNKLSSGNIALLRLWHDMPKNFSEYNFLKNVAAFPLIQEDYANKIIDTVFCS